MLKLVAARIELASCRRGEGRTTVSLVVAKHLAARGLRPVVVDADSQNPNLARNCGISDHAGWGDVLEGQRPLGEALVAAVEDGVTLMPWRGSTVGSTTLASSPGIATGFAMLRERYDLTLLDTMPLANEASIGEFAALAASIRLDGLYLIHDTRRSADGELARACGQLRAAGVRVEGIIENFVAPERASPPAGQEESKPVAGPQLAAYG
jgi:Mrp family chromosome partitioning ATPase